MKIIKEQSNVKVFEEVKVRTPRVSDMIKAERLGDKSPMKITLALISLVCTFDGEQKTVEELERELSTSDFLLLTKELEHIKEDVV